MAKRTREALGDVAIMMCGLPGNMGIEVSQACIRRGFILAGIGLTVRDRVLTHS
jgi:hypothetical protein